MTSRLISACAALIYIFISPFISKGAYTFESSSRLSSGSWVKIYVGDTGIYDIPYAQLREMGFEDPEKVGVFGRGGTVLPMTFTSASGKAQMTDGLSPVAVHHHDGHLYFYGVGVKHVTFTPGTDLAVFANTDSNIYALEGAYFLTDAYPEPLQMSSHPETTPYNIYTEGYDYVNHHEDLVQNNTNTGQVFWGESLLAPTSSHEWKISMPYANLEEPMAMVCNVYASKLSTGNVSFGFRNTPQVKTLSIVPYIASSFKIQPDNKGIFVADSPEQTVFVESSDLKTSFLYLDHWIISYTKNIPDFATATNPQERLFISAKDQRQSALSIPTDKEIIVFDVSDPVNPRLLPISSVAEDKLALFKPASNSVSLVMADKSQSQPSISRWEKVANSDLHAMAAKGADFLIITVSYMRQYADQIADLHRQHDGIEVAVVEPQTIYNEFSAGIPDPMAYRGLIKMMSAGEVPLKNCLFIGPQYADFRRALREGRPEGIIAFQENMVTSERSAAHASDFYGMTADYIKTGSIHEEKVAVGIGILPISTPKEGETAVAKIGNYLTRTDFAEIANEFISVSGPGDNHTHDFQAVDIADYIKEFAPDGWISSVLCLDSYGYKGAKNKFFRDLDRGKLLTFYHGHGGPYQTPPAADFLSGSETSSMTNPHTGFFYFGGCELTIPDKGIPGMGQFVVTSTPHGAMGAITASRTTWSGQNYDLSRRISYALFNNADGTPRTMTPTIGEVMADAKTSSRYANELCYLYIGDPALRVPLPLYTIKAEMVLATDGGHHAGVSGEIIDREGNRIKDFNGTVVMKAMAPEYEEECANIISGAPYEGTDPNKKLIISYPDTRLERYETEVIDGQFELAVTLPAGITDTAGELPLYISAYDPASRLSAAGRVSLYGSTAPPDRSVPSISASFDNSRHVIKATVYDDLNLDQGCLSASGQDGMEYLVRPASSDEISSSRDYFILPSVTDPGDYTVTLTAIDNAGYKVTHEFRYTIQPINAPVGMSVSAKAVDTDLLFILNGGSGRMAIVIEDAVGNQVASISADGGEAVWNLLDNSGTRVASGLYSAFAIDPEDPSRYSDKISFAVFARQ